MGGLAGDTGHECQGVGKPRSRDQRVLGDTRVPDEGYLEQVESGSSVYGDKQQHRGQDGGRGNYKSGLGVQV